MENLSEENLRRDTYLVTSAKCQLNCKTTVCQSTPKVAKPANKPVATKAKKIVVSKKKLSPISGNCKKEILKKINTNNRHIGLKLLELNICCHNPGDGN